MKINMWAFICCYPHYGMVGHRSLIFCTRDEAFMLTVLAVLARLTQLT